MRVVDLLELAAPEPTRPFDHAVITRARGGRHRRWAWLAGIVAIGGAAIPTTAALLPAGNDGGTRVETIKPEPDTDTPQPEPGTEVPPTRAVRTSADRMTGAIGSAPNAGSRWPVADDMQPVDAPESDGCAAQSTGTDVYAYPVGVFGTGQNWTPESCSFKATADAGYRASGAWTIRIKRDGHEIRYSSSTSPSCGAVGTIHPGDNVTLSASDGSDYAPVDQAASYVEAGSKAHC